MILSLFVLSAITLYSMYGWFRGRENTQVLTRQKALDYADAGLNDALAWLRRPDAGQQLRPGNNMILSVPRENGSSRTTLTRYDDAHRMYISADAIGYYDLSTGDATDPVTPGQPRARMASVHATILFTSVSEYVAAVNSPLHIADGSQLGTGDVYAPTLIFDGAATLGRAFAVDPIDLGPHPGTVHMTGMVQLNTPLNVATIDSFSTRPLFLNRGTAPPAGGFSGLVPEPPPDAQGRSSHVYYVPDPAGVDLGAWGAGLTVRGVYTIYAIGPIRVHGDISLADKNSWVALVSEDTIYVAGDGSTLGRAPDVLSLNGTFVANGGLQAEPAVRPATPGNPCALTMTGGIVGQSLNTASVWKTAAAPNNCTRTYTYPDNTYLGFSSPNLYLPNVSTLLDYKITQGRAVPLSQTGQQPLAHQQ
jgi:hypothetical protein